MTANAYVDACGFIPVSSGTGDFVVSAAAQGCQTPASAAAVNAAVYSYRAESADKSQWEEGFGAYTVASVTLARTTVTASSTGAKVSFSAAPNVYITALSQDLQNASLLTGGALPAARIIFAVKADQTTATSTTLPVNPAVQQFHPSAAKARCSLTGSTGAIQEAYNVTSVSRTSAGLYVATFTTNFANTNYTAVTGLETNGGAAGFFVTIPNGGRTVSTLTLQVFNFSGVAADATSIFFACYGVL